jgi:hypothetical protein
VSFANFVIKGILLNSDGNVSSVKGRHKLKVSGSVRWYDSLAESSDGGNMGVKFEAVRKFVLSLEGVEEVRSYGTPGFKMRGVLFARLKEDGETLVVRMEFEARDEMISTAPEIYFVTDHYLNYKWILVRLPKIEPDAMKDLLRGAWRMAEAEKKSGKKKRKALGRKTVIRRGAE